MTTTNLNKLRARWYDLPVPAAAAICIFALVLIAGLVNQLRTAPSAAAQPTPTPAIIILASPLPVVPPTAVPIQVAAVLPNTLRRAVVAYDSPNGSVIGAIEQGRAYNVLARFGDDWLQADVTGSGIVWLRSADVLDLPAGLADLQPAPAPVVVYVNQPALAVATPTEQVYQTTNDQPPTPAWATAPAVINPADFTAPDPKARCQFVGCL